MTGTIESDGTIAARNGNIEARPIVAGTGVAMNQHNGLSRTLHHEVKISFVDLNKKRFSARLTMSHTAGDIALL
jgi:hypothetical protein